MKNLIDAYIPTIRRHPTQRVKIPCGTKKPERIKLPRAKNFDRFEIKEYVKKSGFQQKIDRAIQTAFYLGVPVEQMCNNISVDYGTNGSVLITADIRVDIRAKTQEQKEKLLEVIRDAKISKN